MSATMNLNTRVHSMSKAGKREVMTVRDVIRKGHGKAYNTLSMFEEWPMFLEEYRAEQVTLLNTAREKVRQATKAREKARWWLDIGIYEYARDNRYIITREEHDEAYDDLQKAEEDLLACLQEETVLLPLH